MGTFHLVLAIAVAVVAYQFYQRYFVNRTPVKLDIDANGWFGSGEKHSDREEIVPFEVNVTDETLADLKGRLGNARIPLALEDSNDFEYGFNPTYLQKVIDHWRKNYRWRHWEHVINELPQFTTEIEGLKIHFIHVKPPEEKYTAIPILMTHGWPGNVFEFHKIIPLMIDPKKAMNYESNLAFEVVAPSIPGYGWSDTPKKKGFDQWATARIFRKLMLRLGIEKFFVQGGDWGSLVSKNIAHYYPENVLGVHLNMLYVDMLSPQKNFGATFWSLLGLVLPPSMVFSSPRSFSYGIDHFRDLMIEESGYMHIQATKPDTVGTALTDSPAGLAAYILEKFSTWVNRRYRQLPDGGLTEKFSMDELLTIVMIYWINGNIASSQRYYKEYFQSPLRTYTEKSFLHVPTGFAAFPNELLYGGQPEEILATVVNLTRYVEMPNGGHFAAFEEPRLLALELIRFVDGVLL